MPQIKVIDQQSQSMGEMTDTSYGAAIPLDGAYSYAAQCAVTVDTPTAKTFLSGVAASKTIQDLTYTAASRGTAGNSITVAYTGGGTAGAEVVTVNGNAISIQIQSGTSTATQIKAAFDASGAATALAACAISGTGSNAQTTVSAQSLTGGVNSTVNTTTDQITITGHGYTTGLKGQASSTGTLPAGLSTSTDYFVIVVDANTIQLASSLANAEAGTAIDLTNQGSSGATNTFTPTSLAGASVIVQQSCDPTDTTPSTWSDEGSATTISGSANVLLKIAQPYGNWARIKYTITAGRMSAVNTIVVKGPN